MTTANQITLFRILLIPLFVAEMAVYFQTGRERDWVLSLAAFGLAAALDGVDGYVARRFNQRTPLGAVLDPTADKLLLTAAVVLLTFDSRGRLARIPGWFAATVIGRDVLLSAGVGVVRWARGAVRVRPRLAGKAATAVQMVFVVWILLKGPAISAGCWGLAAGLSLLAGFQYLGDAVQQWRVGGRSRPA